MRQPTFLSRDLVFWYGEMDFVPHLWALTGSGVVQAQVQFLLPISSKDTEQPEVLADASFESVAKAYLPVV